MSTPDQDAALAIINQVENALGSIVRQAVLAFKDDKVSIGEGISLAFGCLSLASTITALVEAATQQDLDDDILWVLEHSDRVIVEDGA